MARKRKLKVETMTWDDYLDYNSVVPCDPLHLTPRNRARHRYILDMMLEVEDVDTAHKILQTYPYLQREYAKRLSRVRRELTARLVDLEDVLIEE